MSKLKEVKIYVLKDPESLEIRYVGSTTNLLNNRLAQHKHNSKTKGTHKQHWLSKLYDNNTSPIIECIEICNIDNYQDRETFWINYYKKRVNLTNTNLTAAGIVINRKISSIEKSAIGHQKAIIQLDTNLKVLKTWDSIKKASIELGILKTAIGNVLKGRAKTAGGFHWVYKEFYDSNYKVDLSKQHIFIVGIPIEVILNDNTKKHFNSIIEAAKFYKTCGQQIRLVINNAGGKQFMKKHNINRIVKL